MTESTWFLAVCVDCEPILPQPFRSRDARDEWADTHREFTGHEVKLVEHGEHERPYRDQI